MNQSLKKRIFTIFVLGLGICTGCGVQAQEKRAFDPDATMHALTREDGSGTRQAFVDLFELYDEKGVDAIHPGIAVTNATSVMMMSTAGDPYAIGYTSLGAMNDMVKPVAIDGVRASVQTVEDGTYPIARPFYFAIKDDLPPAGEEFVEFVLSREGENIIAKQGYVATGTDLPFQTSHPQGSIMVTGSSSIAPVMEKLKERYAQINPKAEIVVQQSDSSSGLSDVANGTAAIGMSSRALKPSELKRGLTPIAFAKDGIVVIVNPANPVESLTMEQVRSVYRDPQQTWRALENHR